MKNVLWRTLVVLHRYLGIAVGILMLIWFASGIVMMYVEFPEFSERDRTGALEPIPWQACCRVADGLIPDDLQFYRVQVEGLLGIPVLRLRRPPRPDAVVDLTEGVGVTNFTFTDARAIAVDAATRLIGRAGLGAGETIDEDQWTVGRFRRDRPLYRFSFDDPERSTIYVSGTSGRIVLRTTATQRSWNWVGAIPHWFYLTALRSDGPLWTATITWAAILGTFLTVLGLYLGIAQFRRGKDRRLSPYRGLFYWHHLAGLVFGITTLTFVVSGLISMNPWGFLEGGGGGGEIRRLEGVPPEWGEVRKSLANMQAKAPNAVSLTTAPLDGKLYWLVTAADGSVTRFDAEGDATPLQTPELAAAAERMLGASGISTQALLSDEDAYYFGLHEEVALPVYRIIANDAEQTRYYLDPVSGALLRRADTDARWHRWLFSGLHRLDFAAWLRARPAWDIIMITLLLGGLAGSGTGIYLAVRRIRSDLMVLFRLVTGTRSAQPAPHAEASELASPMPPTGL
jgi:PepSY-associated TM region